MNVLNDLLAQAEINAIQNAQDILEAEQALEDYVLSKAGEKVDSAKYYAGLYFATLKEIEQLQVQELEAKAARVLVNQGAILAREYIYEQIEANNDTIAQNEALIAAIKEHQTMTPEEAEAALHEAREALNAAYTAYRNVKEEEQAAQKNLAELNGKVADFTQGWYDWTYELASMLNTRARRSNAGRFDDTPLVVLDDEEVVLPINLDKKTLEVEVGEYTVMVPTYGYRVRTEEGVEFLPLFSEEADTTYSSRYPDVDVYDASHRDHRHLQTLVIAPATIEYDNIKTALDNAAERKQKAADRNIARQTRRTERVAAWIEEKIDAMEDTIAMHQAYVDAAAETVAKAEDAYRAAKASADSAEAAIPAAWKAFQDHMVANYPFVKENLFIDRFIADTTYMGAQRDSLENRETLDQLEKVDTNALRAGVKTYFEAYAAAKGKVKKALDSLWASQGGLVPDPNPQTPEDNDTTALALAWDKFETICKEKWNPDFADAVTAAGEDGLWKVAKVESGTPGEKAHWYIAVVGGDPIYAGATQDSTMNAKFAFARAQEHAYAAFIDNLAGAITDAQKKEADDAVTEAQKRINTAQTLEDNAWIDYVSAYNTLSELLGMFPAKLYAEFNPEFEVFNWVVFPTDAMYAPNLDNVDYAIRGGALDGDGNWRFEDKDYHGAKPGTAQLALLNAVKEIVDYREDLAEAKTAFEPYDEAAILAKARLDKANAALIEALGGDPKKDTLEDFAEQVADADELYQAYLDAKAGVMDISKAREALWAVYQPYPDYYGPATGHNHPYPTPKNLGWIISSYNVDYTATYVGLDGKDYPIARLMGDNYRQGRYNKSLAYKVEKAQEMIDETLPKQLEKYTTEQNKNVQDFKDKAAQLMAKINAFKSYEKGYNDWVEDRMEASEAINEAKIATYDVTQEYNAAMAEYEAVEAVANEWFYVYDPHYEIEGVYHDHNGFAKVPVAAEIERLEKENEELEAENEFLRNVLRDGKKVLSVVNEIIDQKIAVISDNIQIMVAIAAEYRGIMNAYLGITDEEDVEGETGPLDGEGEGDDEE